MLKRGGLFRFFEHVRSDSPVWAQVQDVVTPAWRTLMGGCYPNRATLESIQGAGFVLDSIEQFPLGPYPTRPQVLGTARRSSWL